MPKKVKTKEPRILWATYTQTMGIGPCGVHKTREEAEMWAVKCELDVVKFVECLTD